MKNINYIKYGNNYSTTDIKVIRRGSRGRLICTTYCTNEYGSRYANDDIFVAKNYKALLAYAESIGANII
jgi:hypothetical protein